MNSSHVTFSVLITILLLSGYFSDAQDLTAVYSNVSLPSGRDQPSAIYDGDDTVYIFGGIGYPLNCSNCGSESTGEVLKYSISKDTIQHAGKLPLPASGGSTVLDRSGNIYHLTGQYVLQYFPETESFRNASKIPVDVYLSATIQPDSQTALIIGGVDDPTGMYSLNLTTLEAERIAEMPAGKGTHGMSAIWVEDKGAAYIFDGYDKPELTNITKYTRSRNELEILQGYFPVQEKYSSAVFDGQYGYIVAGFGSDDTPPSTIMQFSPETEEIKFLEVNGYPAGENEAFLDTAAVFVEKLNRIYFFGGYLRSEGRYMHEIWYITLNSLY